jgi:glycosyltransferase involved in cell wall biosynthesis
MCAHSLFIQSLKYFRYYLPFKLSLHRLRASKVKKNVLCVIPHMVSGGVEKVILTIAQEVDNKKFSFHLITTLPSANEWRPKFESYFQNIVIPAQKNINSLYFSPLYCRCISDLVRKLNIDIILISHSVDGYECLPKLKERLQVGIVDVLHNNVYPPIEVVTKSAPYVDRRICISDKLKNYILETYKKHGIPRKYAERLEVINNGVDTRMYCVNAQTKGRFKARYSIPEESKLVSFIGRLSEEKNPLLFVEIGARILAQTAAKVHLLEAMSMGIPVISTDAGAISEVIENDVNGFLIDLGKDNDDLAKSFQDKILDLIEGGIDYNTYSSKARETIASNFTLNIMGSKYQRVFEELVK